MWAIVLSWTCIFAFTLASTLQPVVKSKAGIFQGRYLPEFEQDLYLGVKYAPQPVRFTPAQLAKDTPKIHYNVTQYGTDCPGYGSDTTLLIRQGWTTLGEDCLTLTLWYPVPRRKNCQSCCGFMVEVGSRVLPAIRGQSSIACNIILNNIQLGTI